LDEGAYFIPERMFARPPAGAALAKDIARLCSPVPVSAAEAQWLLHEYGTLNSSAAGLPALLQILTDILFQGNAVFQAAQQALRAPVYMYRFDWQTPCFGGLYAAHAVDIPFVFGTLDYSQPAFGAQDSAERRAQADPRGIRYELSRTVQKAWAAFARKGSPGHSGLPDWPNYDENHRATLILDSQCRLEVDPLPERRKLAAQMKVPGRPLATVS
jgi:para-nitrobenzyl esterase